MGELDKIVVCIIDDDPSIQEIYRMKFVQEGFSVISAVNGEEGIALVKAKRPDIVFLDIQMPVKNGVEVLEVMKADPELSRIPVVILSNQDDQAWFKRIGELNATKFYLIKALTTPQKAVDIVREVLHRS
ncbi:MAG: response regulator [Candidatus Moranbacteria bacterium]|nr:response regulator [Candidatus Moranbacteria bacterium]MBP6034123.1 response regulator [Candidatus Moranbacteria bacterium]MBP7695875.1 response regulator [Candidatus Moranbacteria bacterium]